MSGNQEHLQQLYIDGQWVAPTGSAVLRDVINPADGTASHRIAFGGAADVDLAVRAAHRAFPAYSQMPLSDRLGLLERIAAIYERRLGDIAAAVTAEMGAPQHSLATNVHAPIGLWHLRTTAAVAKDFPFERDLGATRLLREPIGVCALITPWNWPMNQVLCKVAPALASGCTIVLKPSQNAPLSAVILAEIIDEAGVPPGVFNLVQGEGSKLGEALASHPLVDLVSLTGSNPAGAAVAQAAANGVKRVSLELGGKSANIVLDDVDMPAVIAHAVHLMMSNTGQSCNAPARLLVPAARLAEVENIAAEACRQLVVGDPRDPATTIGPVANERQYGKVRAMIDLGVEEGATLLCGGSAPPSGLPGGFYVQPTIFSRVENSMRIAREEIFGPVLVILPYRSEEEAVAIANDSEFGLSGYVSAGSLERARSVARRMRTGMVHLNGAPIDLMAPFGGYKQSGNGREWGAAGLEEFLETKSVMGWSAANA